MPRSLFFFLSPARPKVRPCRVYRAYHSQHNPIEAVFPVSGRWLDQLLVATGELTGFPINFTVLRWTCTLQDYLAGKPPEQLRIKVGLSVVAWQSVLDKLTRLAV